MRFQRDPVIEYSFTPIINSISSLLCEKKIEALKELKIPYHEYLLKKGKETEVNHAKIK